MEAAYLEKIEQGYQAWQNEKSIEADQFSVNGRRYQRPSVFYRFNGIISSVA